MAEIGWATEREKDTKCQHRKFFHLHHMENSLQLFLHPFKQKTEKSKSNSSHTDEVETYLNNKLEIFTSPPSYTFQVVMILNSAVENLLDFSPDLLLCFFPLSPFGIQCEMKKNFKFKQNNFWLGKKQRWNEVENEAGKIEIETEETISICVRGRSEFGVYPRWKIHERKKCRRAENCVI